MGEKSRLKKEGREVKDPLRWLRAEVDAKRLKMEQLSALYHQCKGLHDKALARLEASVATLTADGHPFYKNLETPPGAEAAASEVASNEASSQ